MLTEFKEFAMRGNVMDMAIGVILGGAFGKIVAALVDDILMPILGLLTGGIDLSRLHIAIGDAVIQYGSFFQAIIDFVIIAFCIFIMVKQMNRLRKKQEAGSAEAPPPPRQEVLLEEIRDILKTK